LKILSKAQLYQPLRQSEYGSLIGFLKKIKPLKTVNKVRVEKIRQISQKQDKRYQNKHKYN